MKEETLDKIKDPAVRSNVTLSHVTNYFNI